MLKLYLLLVLYVKHTIFTKSFDMKRMYRNDMGLATDRLLPNYASNIFQERINTTLVILEKKLNLNVFDENS